MKEKRKVICLKKKLKIVSKMKATEGASDKGQACEILQIHGAQHSIIQSSPQYCHPQ
jgi:hypothetical protein